MGPWKELLAGASTDRTLKRAKSALGRGTAYEMGQGGYDPTKPLTSRCDCSGFVSWSIGVPRELPPGSQHWLCTDSIWEGGGAVGSGLFDRKSPGQAMAGDIYVYPDSGGHQGHVGIITETANGRPVKVIHCSKVPGEAIRVTSPRVFEKNSKARIVAVDYGALRALFGVEEEHRQCRLILGKWSGDDQEPFTYKCFPQASLVGDHFEIGPSVLAQWLGRTDDRTAAMPVADILKGWNLSYWTDSTHMRDSADPRVYVFLPAQEAPSSPPPAAAPTSGDNEALRHALLRDDPVLRNVVSQRLVLKPTGGMVDGCGAVQDALNHLAETYPDYRVDTGASAAYRGFYGPKTAQAIKSFQATHCIQPNGWIGHDTLLALDAAVVAYDANSRVDTTRVEPDIGASGAKEDFRKHFMSQVIGPAQACQRATGVPASISIAQAILESNWGSSRLSCEARNYFGIKGTGPAGSVRLPTYEFRNGKRVRIEASFRAYHDLEECFKDHGDLIAHRKWSNGELIYAKAMRCTKDPRKFAEALEGVYATDPNYAESLISLMKQYELTQYDV